MATELGESRSVQLADQIETAILRGKIPVGSRLGTKEQLRHGFDCAYGTLNEALRMLQQRGYVVSRSGPGGGLFASAPAVSDRIGRLLLGFSDEATFADCAAVRRALGKRVIVEAAGARTERDVEDLRAIVAAMEAAIDDDEAYSIENRRFHRKLADCVNNRVLANLYTALMEVRELQRGLPDGTGIGRERNCEVHQEVAEAIASGSRSRATRAAELHERSYRSVHSTESIVTPKGNAR